MAEESRTAALTIAMAIVPTLYSRNKLFELFRDPGVTHAQSRARLIRSLLRQLASGTAGDVLFERGAPCVVTFRVPSLHLSRRVELTELELGCLLFLVARAGMPDFGPTVSDRVALERALATLPRPSRLETLDAP
jgi:hypothetical protein